MCKGPNYREQKTINWEICRQKIADGLEKCIESLNNDGDYQPWKDLVLSKVDQKIEQLRNRRITNRRKQVLKDQEVAGYLTELQSKFVIVPIDKASGNLALICKKFYVEEILREIGKLGNESETYVDAEIGADNIIENNCLYADHLKLQVNDKNKTLPIMYWMPKMHKTPVGKRFIIASKFCSTKPLSKAMSKIFNLFYNQIERFHGNAKFLSGYNKFWVLKNAEPVTEILKKVNARHKAKSISTFDFSTLYNKIPHSDLIDKLCQIIDFVFQGGDKKFVRLGANGKAFWGNKSSKYPCFSKTSLKAAVKDLITGCYFTVGNITMRQCIGIPMGIDPAPFWANLYLYFYEEKFITNLIRNDRPKAKYFHSIKRFVDDLLAINDSGEFSRQHSNMYPAELDLKLEHSGDHATFLCLDIRIENEQFVWKLYDKRDDFPFSIVRMPYKCSNIPENIFYASIVGEFLRIGRSTILLSDFLPKVKQLLARMDKQGSSKERTKRALRKVVENHRGIFAKFGTTNTELLNSVLN